MYENPLIKQWFRDYGIEINENLYALSQLVQWIWRSAIRNGERVSLYIPSSRMRTLFEQFLHQDKTCAQMLKEAS